MALARWFCACLPKLLSTLGGRIVSLCLVHRSTLLTHNNFLFNENRKRLSTGTLCLRPLIFQNSALGPSTAEIVESEPAIPKLFGRGHSASQKRPEPACGNRPLGFFVDDRKRTPTTMRLERAEPLLLERAAQEPSLLAWLLAGPPSLERLPPSAPNP